MSIEQYRVVGMMSGTSLDGMDLVLCRFQRKEGQWRYQMVKTEMYEYPDFWKKKLIQATELKIEDFLTLHNEYGVYIGTAVNRFLKSGKLHADLVSVHGHTIFHQPERNFTYQLGSGATLAATCGISTVSDFRTTDVALGGQGAPLVPLGDEWLFSDFAYCLNLGGFANISHRIKNKRIACDICPVNLVANDLSLRLGFAFDRDGDIGSKGNVIPGLVGELNDLSFYAKPGPKSLGREWVESAFFPVLARYPEPVEDLLRSIYEHIAFQISSYINAHDQDRVLVTGGGAFNTFLLRLIQQKTNSELVIPDNNLVNFKEALIFAFLGLLRFLHEINCLASVTGSSTDSSAGVINLVIKN